MTEVDGEGWRVQHVKLGDLIGCIDDHPGLLDEREDEDCIDGDVGAGGNKEGCLLALARQVGQGELEGNGQGRRNRHAVPMLVKTMGE